MTTRVLPGNTGRLSFSGDSEVHLEDMPAFAEALAEEGLLLQLQDRYGQTVLEELIPGGPYQNRSGWTVRIRGGGQRGEAKYRASMGKGPNGIRIAQFKWNGTRLRSKVLGTGGDYSVSAQDGPFSLSLLPADSQGSDLKECAAGWQLNCQAIGNQTTIRCEDVPEPEPDISVIDGVLRIYDRANVGNTIIVTGDEEQISVVYVGSPALLGENCEESATGAVCHGADRVVIDAGGGNDVVLLFFYGSTLNVPAEIYGGDGNDDLRGGEKENRIYGGAGFDKLTGGPDKDELHGGPQADQLDGQGGDDALFGGPGDDRLSGGNGVGNDADQIFGGEGIDTVTYLDHQASVEVTFDGVANDGLIGEYDNVHSDVESLATEFLQDLNALEPGSELLVSDSVWSGSQTPFALSTEGNTQVVAFYEVMGRGVEEGPNGRYFAARCALTVAARELGSTTWTKQRLNWREQEPLWFPNYPPTHEWPSCDTSAEWTRLYDKALDDAIPPEEQRPEASFIQIGPQDGHNRIVLAFDQQGYLHLSANMHVDPMRYWRSQSPVRGHPSRISGMERHPVIDRDSVSNPLEDHPASGWAHPHFVADPVMPSDPASPGYDPKPTPYEQDVTYPSFHKSAEGDFLMTYRLGSSGQGDLWAARFDPVEKTWARTSDGPFLGYVNYENATPPKNTTGAYTASLSWDGSTHILAAHRERQKDQWEVRKFIDLNMAKVLSYLHTRDWTTFRNVAGDELPLPVTQETSEAMIESSLEGGIHLARLGRDSAGNPTAGYPIYDYDPTGRQTEAGAPEPEPMFCPDQVAASMEGLVLKARVAIARSGKWHKLDLACSPWVWGSGPSLVDGPRINASYLYSFVVTAPQEQILEDGTRAFVSKVVFPAPTEQDENNKFKKWFVIDYDTLEVRSQDDDPGGTLQVPYLVPNASHAQCRFWSLGSVIETIDVHAEDEETSDETFPMKRRDLYRKSLGEADAGDYYRLRHEVWWSVNWYEYYGAADPSELYVQRTLCDKGTTSWP